MGVMGGKLIAASRADGPAPRNDGIDGMRSAGGGAASGAMPGLAEMMSHAGRRDLTTRQVSVRAATVDEDERSVEAVIATDRPALVYDFDSGRVIDEVLLMEGAVLPEQVVLLETHVRWTLDAVLGSVRGLHPENGNTVGRLYFASGDESAERAWQKVRQGHVTDMSAGYRVDAAEVLRRGEERVVKGRKFKAGERELRVATKWTLREASLVPIGADEFAKVREEVGGPCAGVFEREERRAMKLKAEVLRYLRTLGLRAEASESEAVAFYDALDGAKRTWAAGLQSGAVRADETPPAEARGEESGSDSGRVTAASRADGPAPRNDGAGAGGDGGAGQSAAATDVAAAAATATREALAAERERCRVIRSMAGEDVPAELVERAIDEGWDESRASLAFLNAVRSRLPGPHRSGPGIVVHGREEDCTERTLIAGLLQRAGLFRMPENASDERRREAEKAAELGLRYGDMSMVDLCRESCRLSGVSVPLNRQDLIRAAVSTGSLTNIFTAVVNAALMTAYTEAPDTTQGWVSEADVPDFKTNERAQLGKTAGLSRLPRGKPADHATLGDSGEEYRIARYAKQFVADEQDIIDDRLSALMNMPREMGAAAARLRPDLVYAILLANGNLSDSIALFEATTHGNLGTTSTALATATLEAAITAMAKQTQSGVILNVKARHLLVPQDLKWTALTLITPASPGTYSPTTYNPLQGEEVLLHVDNRLGVAGVTDPATETAYAGTATNYFLAANASEAPTIEVGYLRGTSRRPVVRSFVLDKGQWGIGWDINHDIGAKALDYRGLYKATGA